MKLKLMLSSVLVVLGVAMLAQAPLASAKGCADSSEGLYAKNAGGEDGCEGLNNSRGEPFELYLSVMLLSYLGSLEFCALVPKEFGNYKNEKCSERESGTLGGNYAKIKLNLLGETALSEFTVETKATTPKQKVTSTFETPETFEGKITSTELESEQTPTSKKLGTLHIQFFGVKCEKLGVKVSGHSLGDAAGVVLVLGEYHLLGLGYIWLLINTVHIECESPFGVELITVGGNLVGIILPILEKTNKFTLVLKGKTGKQEITEFTNDNGETVKPALKTELNENGKPQPSSQNESAEVLLETEKETEIT